MYSLTVSNIQRWQIRGINGFFVVTFSGKKYSWPNEICGSAAIKLVAFGFSG